MQRGSDEKSEEGLRRAVVIVALLSLAYFGVEFGMAEFIGSVSLLADSIDFLEDASKIFSLPSHWVGQWLAAHSWGRCWRASC